MNRHDWVFVGIRLIGVMFVAQGLAGLPDLLDCSIRLKSDASRILDPLTRIAVGASLAFGTARICSWLGDREANRS
jgi:hypothetical protein